MKNKRVVVVVILIVLALLWVLGIYKLSSMNTDNSNGKSSGIIGIFIEDTLDVTNKYGITNSHPNEDKIERASELLNAPLRKVMHASVYFVLACVIIFVTNYLFYNKKYLLSAIITIVLVVIAAGFDEFHQTFVDGRTGAIKDVLIDTAGGIVGVLFYGSYYYVYKRGYRRGLKETGKVGELNEQSKSKDKKTY